MSDVKIIEHSQGKGQAKWENGEWWFRYILDCVSGKFGEWQTDLAPLTEEWFVIRRTGRENDGE